jgi:hypothetical protein
LFSTRDNFAGSPAFLSKRRVRKVTLQKTDEDRPFLSLMVMSRDTYEEQPLRRRLTVVLLEVFVGLGLFILVGLLSVAVWSFVAFAGAPRT